jgi:outer membrane protein OmpA-like peptidoglycan-associated protein
MESKSHVKCKFPWLWLLLPLLLALLGALVANGLIQNDLGKKSRNGLKAAGIAPVGVKLSGQDVTLRGPATFADAAMARVKGIDGVRSVKYISSTDGAAVEASSDETAVAQTVAVTPIETTAETAAVAPVETTVAAAPETTVLTVASAGSPIEVAASIDGKKVALTGVVTSESQRATLVNAAKAAYGDANVIDELTVVGPSTALQDTRIAAFGDLIKLSSNTLGDAKGKVSDTVLSISGTAFTELGKSGVEALVTGAGGTSEITVAAAKTVEEVQENLATILDRSGIQFDTNSAVIKADSLPILDNAVASITQELAAFPNIKIEVAGHTDNVGRASANQQLSQSRAQAVLDYLVSKGVDASRLTAKGYGATKPIADNKTEIARATNRRIEFTVSGS